MPTAEPAVPAAPAADPGLAPPPPEARDAVLAWYRAHGRVLPFRETRDPYAILVSEVMAQQTQIARVVETWGRFLERFPTFRDLAAATPAEVIRAWRGMGYDRRALNLLRSARVVMAEHGGRLPRDVAALERLPGVGPYTARAVAALAFGEPVGAVDTNVRRVLGRIVAGARHADLSAREVQALADAAVPPDAPGEWTHAVMDVGATFCRSRSPRCEACPAVAWCRFARATGADGSAAPRHARTTATRRRTAEPPFDRTTRWLRGRILDRLRDADGHDAGWVALDRAIGTHDADAVRTAARALAADGLVEIHGTRRLRARLARH